MAKGGSVETAAPLPARQPRRVGTMVRTSDPTSTLKELLENRTTPPRRVPGPVGRVSSILLRTTLRDHLQRIVGRRATLIGHLMSAAIEATQSTPSNLGQIPDTAKDLRRTTTTPSSALAVVTQKRRALVGIHRRPCVLKIV